ncbi:MAG: hypothetical protein N2554_06485, partial [Fimbriimonadales bacterium]|nr:hypothetical protein [Fimbriimonadales bacterium]
MEDLYQLANLVQQRNQLEHAMAQLIGEPFTPAKVAEFLARRVFGIHSDEGTPFDGYFTEGALAGKSVAIRYLPERGRLYSFKASLTEPQSDYYLLMVGADGRRKHALQVSTAFTIDAVYLVDARHDAPLWETRDKAFPEWLRSRQVYPVAHCPLIT